MRSVLNQAALSLGSRTRSISNKHLAAGPDLSLNFLGPLWPSCHLENVPTKLYLGCHLGKERRIKSMNS